MQFPRHVHLWALLEPAYQTGDLAHDALHVGRVYDWCLKLAQAEGEDPDLAGACGLVHDQVYVPKDAADRALASTRSADAAIAPLQASGYPPSDIDAIVRAVSGSSWSRQLEAETRLGAILQDADRLDALGAIGVARTFACAQTMVRGASDHGLYSPADPFAVESRVKDDRRFALDHFYVKLLKLAEGMHFSLSRQEAARRHRFMQAFLDELRSELTGMCVVQTKSSGPC